MNWVKDSISKGAHAIFLWFDSVVYWLASNLYGIFIKISSVRIFDSDFLEDFASRIYVLMGVLMLFFLAYALLNAIIDPDKLTKNDKSVTQMAPNIVISLVIIGFLPTIFNYIYDIQEYVLKTNLIGTLVFGQNTSKDDITKFGNYLSVTTLDAFFEVTDNSDSAVKWDEIKYNMYHSSGIGSYSKYFQLTSLAGDIVKGKIIYKILICTLAGALLVYLLLTFCLDLGLRAVKLAFLQLIAPIPVIMRALPNGKDTFNKWFKTTSATYFEVFIRVLIMYMMALFASQIDKLDLAGDLMVKVVIIMGILMFAREAPKLLSEVLGLPQGNLKLGFKDFTNKIKNGGGFIAAGAIAAGVTGLARGIPNHFRANKSKIQKRWNEGRANFASKGIRNKAKGIGKMGLAALEPLGAGIRTGAAGFVRGGVSSASVDSFSRLPGAVGTGAQGATDAQAARIAYRARNGNKWVSAMGARVRDTGRSIGNWFTGGAAQFNQEMSVIKKFQGEKDDIATEINRIKAKFGTTIPTVKINFAGDKAADAEYAKYNGMSYAAAVQSMRQLMETKVERSAFNKNQSGQLAYEAAVRNKAADDSIRDKVINMLEKATNQYVGDNAFNNSPTRPGNIPVDEYANLRNKFENINRTASASKYKTGEFKDNVAFTNMDATDKALSARQNEIMALVSDLNKKE